MRYSFILLCILFPSLVFAQRCGFDFSEGVLIHPFGTGKDSSTVNGLVILLSKESIPHSEIWKTKIVDTSRTVVLCYQNDTSQVEYADNFKWSGLEYKSHWNLHPKREYFIVREAKTNYFGVFGYEEKKSLRYITIIDTMQERPGGMYEKKIVGLDAELIFNFCSAYSVRYLMKDIPIRLSRAVIKVKKKLPQKNIAPKIPMPPPLSRPPEKHISPVATAPPLPRTIYKKDSILAQLRKKNPISFYENGEIESWPSSHAIIIDTTSDLLPLPDSLLTAGKKYRWVYHWEMPLWDTLRLVCFERSKFDTVSVSTILATYDSNYRLLHAAWFGTTGQDFNMYFELHKLPHNKFYFAEVALRKPDLKDSDHFHFTMKGDPPPASDSQIPDGNYDIPTEFWSIDKQGVFRLDSTEITHIRSWH